MRSNAFTEWIFTFLPTFQTISKEKWVETYLLFITFPKVSITTKLFLETVQKVAKKVDVHLFENFVYEKN